MLKHYKKCQICKNCVRTEYEDGDTLYNELNCSKRKTPENCNYEPVEETKK